MSSVRNKPRKLGVLLCYNDGDILEEAIRHLLNNGHELVVWNHGSDDETSDIINQYRGDLIEVRDIPRSFDFYRLYQHMSENLIKNYASRYDWISWPDQDEILEGPDRTRSYSDWIDEVLDSDASHVHFRNYNFWFTSEDPLDVKEATLRVRRYSLFSDCPPRVRAWRAPATNIRLFNHNPIKGKKYPTDFNLRHYPMRSHEHMTRRLEKDRANIQSNGMNFHYDNMASWRDKLIIAPSQLHYDDGVSPLNPTPIFDWRAIYGRSQLRLHERILEAMTSPRRVLTFLWGFRKNNRPPDR